MIAILNIGPAPKNRYRGATNQPIDPLGDHLYQIKINNQPVAVFTHRRSDTLATCLSKAAEAARTAQEKALAQLAETARTDPS